MPIDTVSSPVGPAYHDRVCARPDSRRFDHDDGHGREHELRSVVSNWRRSVGDRYHHRGRGGNATTDGERRRGARPSRECKGAGLCRHINTMLSSWSLTFPALARVVVTMTEERVRRYTALRCRANCTWTATGTGTDHAASPFRARDRNHSHREPRMSSASSPPAARGRGALRWQNGLEASLRAASFTRSAATA
jgi:hypothetical protein